MAFDHGGLTAELAGEIGTIERFNKEGSLALYLGMATLDNSPGKYQGTKRRKHVNTRAKAAMMTALDRHRKYVPQSQKYYEKKRAQGKSHNQAIRALGRHLCRIIYKMLKEKREYEVRPLKGDTPSQAHLEIVAYRANTEEKNLGERIKSQSNKRREEKSPHRLEISSGMFRLFFLDNLGRVTPSPAFLFFPFLRSVACRPLPFL